MKRTHLWIAATCGGFVAYLLGITTADTLASGAYFTGMALVMHYFFGESA